MLDINEQEMRNEIDKSITKNKVLIAVMLFVGLVTMLTIFLGYHRDIKAMVILNIVLVVMLVILVVEKFDNLLKLNKMKVVLNEYSEESDGEEKRKKALFLTLFSSIYFEKFKKFFR